MLSALQGRSASPTVVRKSLKQIHITGKTMQSWKWIPIAPSPTVIVSRARLSRESPACETTIMQGRQEALTCNLKSMLPVCLACTCRYIIPLRQCPSFKHNLGLVRPISMYIVLVSKLLACRTSTFPKQKNRMITEHCCTAPPSCVC